MPRHDRIGEKWHLAEVTGNIRPANPDAMHPHQRLPYTRLARRFDICRDKLLRLFQYNCFHENSRLAKRLV